MIDRLLSLLPLTYRGRGLVGLLCRDDQSPHSHHLFPWGPEKLARGSHR